MSLLLVQLCPSCVCVTNIFQLKRSKVSCLSMRTQQRENTDYQSAIRRRGSVQSSFAVKYQQTETQQRFETGEQDENTWGLCVGDKESKGRSAKTGYKIQGAQKDPIGTSAWAHGSADSETMDILETAAYDRRQRRNMVPNIPLFLPTVIGQ